MSTVKIPLAVNIYDPRGDEWRFIYSNVTVSVRSHSVVPSITRKEGLINYFHIEILRPYDLTGSQLVYLNFINKNTNQVEVVYRNIFYEYISTSNVNWYPLSISGLKGWWQPLYGYPDVNNGLVNRTQEENHMFLIENRTYNDSYLNTASVFVKRNKDYFRMVNALWTQLLEGSGYYNSVRNYRLCFATQSQNFLSKEYTAFVVASPGKHDPVLVVSGVGLVGGQGYLPIPTNNPYDIPGNLNTLLAVNAFRSKTYSSVTDKSQTASLAILFTYYPVASSSTFPGEYSGDEENYWYITDASQRKHPFLFASESTPRYYVPGISILYNTESTQNPGLQLYGIDLVYKPDKSFYEREITLSETRFTDIPSVFAYRIKQDANGFISYSVTINKEDPVWYTYSNPLPSIDLSDPIFSNHRNEAGVAIGPVVEILYDYNIPGVGNQYAMYRIGCGDIHFYEALFFTRSLSDTEYKQVRDYLLSKYRFGL